MKIVLQTLVLICRSSKEVINFSPQVTYFHGQISAGKSSILHIVDFCFGGNLPNTPALNTELVSVQLTAKLQDHEVLFERQKDNSSSVQITWQEKSGEYSSVAAPIRPQALPIWANDIYNLSDLLFYLLGVTPIKVRKSKTQEDSDLVRLSFRDVMWYCYLEQDHLDSSFYRLEDPFRRLKSRDVMRYVMGYYTDRMTELEIELEEVRDQQLAKIEAAKQVRKFLDDFGYGVEGELQNEVETVRGHLAQLIQERNSNQAQFSSQTHFVDELRGQLREFTVRLAQEEEVLFDLEGRITEQEALRAELLTSKFKLARAESATNVLSGVKFVNCPSCGSELSNLERNEHENCYLCGSQLDNPNAEPTVDVEVIRRDIEARVEDLSESIKRHKVAQERQQQLLDKAREEKALLDNRLVRELHDYDSAYLAYFRNIEQQIATHEERLRGFQQSLRMFASIRELEQEADELSLRQVELRRELEVEKEKLGTAEERVRDLEQTYLAALLAVKVPGVHEDDRVIISTRTWRPTLITADDDSYSFYNAGSGGKKTLLNVCYALAVHEVAERHSLPLPTFLMIDTPMKNIGEEVNQDIFHAFYTYLYTKASTDLSDHQFVIVDKELFKPNAELELDIIERYMAPDDPLISYYRGP